jgi:COMPASS component SWD1
VCDLRKQNRSRIELLETITDEGLEEEENNGQGMMRYIICVFYHSWVILILVMCRSPMTAARFDPTGKNIFVGTASGSILVFNTRTKSVKTPCFKHLRYIKYLVR